MAPGPSHERTFHAEVAVNDERLAAGSGPSKKAAQRVAAERVRAVLRERYDDLEPRPLSAAAPPSPAAAAGLSRGARRSTQRKAASTAKHCHP